MSHFQPPPVGLPLTEIDSAGRPLPLNSVWTKWFIELAKFINNVGAGGGEINHQSLQSLQGGTVTERYHLTAAQAAAQVLAGTIISFAGSVAPAGYLACPAVQTLVSTTTYAALFAAIGYAWGGSGASFGLPFFENGYVPLPGVGIGVYNAGQVIAHSHGGSLFRSGSAYVINTSAAALHTQGNTDVTGGTNNLAAGRGVQFCVKF